MAKPKAPFLHRHFPAILLVAYLLLSVICAISPFDRRVWWAENVPIWLIVLILVLTYRAFRFSNMAYAMMSVLVFLHTIGGHYTFELVPAGFWLEQIFGFTRNHYDRIAHFSVGFYAYAFAELLERKKWTNSRWILYLFPVFTIFTVAAGYEILEWLSALNMAPEAGLAFLGSQGDVWDAQKDMLADGLGAITATIFYWLRMRFSSARNPGSRPSA